MTCVLYWPGYVKRVATMSLILLNDRFDSFDENEHYVGKSEYIHSCVIYN